jgi:hypothetical protein
MNVSLWAEIRRLCEIEKLSQRAISQRMKCCQRTVARALRMQNPPDGRRDSPRRSGLDPWKTKIEELLKRSPEGFASRIHEELKSIPDGYRGGITVVRDYVRKVRRRPSRVYQTVDYTPAQAMQVDWDCCGNSASAALSEKSPCWSPSCATAGVRCVKRNALAAPWGGHRHSGYQLPHERQHSRRVVTSTLSAPPDQP